MIKLTLIIIVFFLGLYFIIYNCKIPSIETFKNDSDEVKKGCPNMLVERDNNYFLYNSRLAIVPGVNPIQFKSLEEYVEFLEWQRGLGINCPVLQLQYSTDPQNNGVYKIKPNIFENQGGLPNTSTDDNAPKALYSNDRSEIFDANMDDPKFNQGHIGYDPQNQYIGLDTPIDKIADKGTKSASAMDTNWGGAAYTKKQIDKGAFVGDYVSKPGISLSPLASSQPSSLSAQASSLSISSMAEPPSSTLSTVSTTSSTTTSTPLTSTFIGQSSSA